MIVTKKFITGCVIALALTTTSLTAFATTIYKTPAEAVASLTGKTVEEVIIDRQSGITYGKIAAEAGKLEEFQQAMQDIYKNKLDIRVANGTMTQKQADALIVAREDRQATCDGTGNGGGFGMGNGRGMGAGRRMQNSSCIYQ